jgi:predicted PurR-regulated permease PerM
MPQVTLAIKHYQRLLFWLLLFVLTWVFLAEVSSILLPFIVGVLVAYFLDPAADKLEEWGLSRTLATVIIIVSFSLCVVGALMVLLPVLFEQAVALLKNIPKYSVFINERIIPVVQNYVSDVDERLVDRVRENAANISGQAVQYVIGLASNVWQSGVAFLNLLSLIVISPIVAFYMLRDWDHMTAKVQKWLPRDSKTTIEKQLQLMDDTISGYMRGQVNVCLLLGCFYAVGLTLAGLESGILIGSLTGLFSFVPFVGMFLGVLVGATVAFFQWGIVEWTNIAVVLGVFGVGQFIEGNFVAPKLIGDRVGLHPVWIMFALLAGGAIWGLLGILIAVPLAAVIGVLVRFGIERYLESALFKGDAKPARKRKATKRKAKA